MLYTKVYSLIIAVQVLAKVAEHFKVGCGYQSTVDRSRKQVKNSLIWRLLVSCVTFFLFMSYHEVYVCVF